MALFLGIAMWLLLCAGINDLQAESAPTVAEVAQAENSPILTSFEQIWHLSEPEQRQWHRVRLEYLVYFYDPLWTASWGRCGEADSYLSLGAKALPIKAGQRILVEGLMQPVRGMRVEDPQVSVLAESVPLEPVSTDGQVAQTALFNKRFVAMAGYVDGQKARDANHLELSLIVEGRQVLGQLVLTAAARVPQLKGKFVRMKGVYFARSEPATSEPKIEVWVQRSEDIEETGTLERDSRFELPITTVAAIASAPRDQLVRIVGTVVAQQLGESLTLRDESGEVVLRSLQTLPILPGEAVEVIGWPVGENGVSTLHESLYRQAQTPLTSVAEVWALPESEHGKWHRVKIEMLVYCFDPSWKALWGRAGGRNDYVSFGRAVPAIEPGQRVLLEGFVRPADNMVIDQPKVTVLESGVPLQPVPTQGRIGAVEHLQKSWVTVEGFVDRQVRSDATHCELNLIVAGRPVIGRLLLPDGMPAPNLEAARVRLTGVYSATQDPVGGLPTIEIWVPNRQHLEVLGTLAQDERFNLPVTAIDQLASVSSDAWVRVVGTVRTQQAGKLLILRDQTGQVTVQTVQARVLKPGAVVEAIGRPSAEEMRLVLRDGIFRDSQAPPAPPSTELPKLRLADQLRELSPEEAARSYPVRLSGVVTWSRPKAEFFFVQDASGGVCVARPPDFNQTIFAGTKVDVTGVSTPGRYVPMVLASHVRAEGVVELPEARPVTLEQALTGVEDAQWVSMSGFVRAVDRDRSWSRAILSTSAGEFYAMLAGPHERWTKLEGAVIRVRGVCGAITNERRQLIGIRMWVPMSRDVEIEEAAPEDPFAYPQRSIASLRQFSSVSSLNRRVRVAGVVIHHVPGGVIHLQDGAEGLAVLSRSTVPLAVGDRIEAVGFPGRENSRVVLREAVYRRVGSEESPPVIRLKEIAPIDAERDGRLVRVEGRLLDLGAHERGLRLIVQSGATIFEALLSGERMIPPEDWRPQSQIALTGVYEIQFDEYRRPNTARIQLRTVADVEVLKRAPWWTTGRAFGVAGALAVVLVLGFGWVLALRRRVHRQTGVIREQEESERAARLEAALTRASKLESLGVLAGGIAHDFNNLLTVVMGNLSLARLDPRIEADTVRCLAESERAAERARDLTQQLLTFAKGGEPMRAPIRLPDLVREAAHFALHGSNVRCEFTIAPDLWLASVDKGQIGQVVQNIVLNASQAMAGGGCVRIIMKNEELAGPRSGLAAGRYVVLQFADTGCGIAPENLARIFEPYFSTKTQGSGLGLATVYSVVTKHHGHVEVKSTVGTGTTFTVWLPAVAETSAPPPAEPPAPPAASRVLLMDDEPSIRALARTVLKRAGCDVTAVEDGAAAVSEYSAAIAAGRAFHVVILDLTVPGGMGGAETMRRLRAIDPQVCAIVSSGYSSDPVMANYQDYGFRARVPKPYQASDLVQAVKRLLPDERA
jgi:signal transduction histidine kinase/uncharacterized protein YdeI (BOF family)/ActR/RegA family two-component response regulator